MIKSKNKSLIKNISLIILSAIFVVLGIFSIIIKSEARKMCFNSVHADTTTTNFYGSSFYVPSQVFYYDYEHSADVMNWTGLTSFSGFNVWTDGVNYYYSNSANQYILDVLTHTWSTMTWIGLTSFNGNNVWTDGVNYYYSSGNTHSVLNVSSHTWSTMTWIGLTNFTGNNIWTDGVNIYYSSSSNQYVLDVSTHTWSTMTWTGLTSFTGQNVWTDGVDYYYSNSSNQYVLDVSTHTWSTMTWTGLFSFSGQYVWTDGVGIYYASASSIFILDVSTHTWSTMTWTGLTSFTGQNVWTDGVDYYFSDSANQYVLNNDFVLINQNDNLVLICNDFVFIQEYDAFNVSFHSGIYSFFTGETVYSASSKLIAYDNNLTLAQNVEKIFDPNNYVDNFSITSSSASGRFLVPFEFQNEYGFVRKGCFEFRFSTNGLSSCDFNQVDFLSDYETENTPPYPYKINNYLRYTNSFGEEILFTFNYRTYGSNMVYYNAESISSLTQFILNAGNTGRPFDNVFFRFSTRTYYLTSTSADNSSNLDAYNNGYNRGRQDGFNDGYSTASDVVSRAQYESGYSAGYVAGSNAGGTYTFLGLISAVIDAPVQYFTNLFSFDVLGTNMANFITALFTFTIVIVILKKVIS